jgi:pyruvate dehydrogenase E2 component (dihydrolipoamide acetyltransferase)
MPALGMAQDTGKVLQWLKHGGEVVAEGEPLVEVETDKATLEIEAPASGTLAEVSTPEGAEVAVGTVIALVLAPGETAGEVPEPVASGDGPEPAATEEPAPLLADPSTPGPRSRGARVSPKARRLAQELGVDLGALTGSGPRGAVVATDVERAAAPAGATVEQPSPGAVATGDGDRFEVATVWRVMAERTQRSWQEVPQFVLWHEVDASRLESWKDAARHKPGCEGVTHTDLLVKICAEALRRHPRVNASWRQGAIARGAAINIAIAIATDDGLVAPVIHRADELDLAAIATRRKVLTEAARRRRLRQDDLRGGTFTISNLGMYGVDAFQAIVDAPQAAILAVGHVSQRPVAVNGVVAIRPMVTLSISFDHRAVDGVRGAEFLQTIASLVSEPAGLVA